MQPVDIYTGCVGLVTARDRFGYQHQPAKIALSSCSNVDVTDDRKIRRRGGMALVAPSTIGDITSMYPTRDVLAFVEGNALSVADRSLAVTRLRDVTPGIHTSFASDMYGRIFHANGRQHGFIENGIAFNWAPNEARRGVNRSTKQFGLPPCGHLLGQLGGRTIIAYQNWLLFSESFNAFSFNRDEDTVPIDSPATMIREVDGGLWVSTARRIWFFAGRDFRTFDPLPRHDAPAITGTDVMCEASELFHDRSGPGVLVTTEDAVLFLTSDGQAINLSRHKIDLPPGSFGCALIEGGRYLVNYTIKE
jgi:hypothetical protein